MSNAITTCQTLRNNAGSLDFDAIQYFPKDGAVLRMVLVYFWQEDGIEGRRRESEEMLTPEQAGERYARDVADGWFPLQD